VLKAVIPADSDIFQDLETGEGKDMDVDVDVDDEGEAKGGKSSNAHGLSFICLL
jgi:hypothetical protein